MCCRNSSTDNLIWVCGMGTVSRDLALFFEFLAQEGATVQFFENWVSCNGLFYEGSDPVASFSRWVPYLGIAWDSYITN